MEKSVTDKVKAIIAQTVGGEYANQPISDDLRLIGNVLDSMAVTSLIVALEENFGFSFNDEDLSAESFATVASLSALIKRKTEG